MNVRNMLFTLLLVPFAVNATAISYDLNAEFSGAVAPISDSPWMSVTFDDGDTAGSVTMTVDSSNLVNDEHIKNLYLNFDDALDLSALSFTYGSGNVYGGTTSMSTGYDSFKADGVGGMYDILLEFTPFISGGTLLEIDFLGDGLLASSFAFSSLNNDGAYEYHLASHIGSTGNDGEGSAWVTDGEGGVPPGCVDCPTPMNEPHTILLLGVGLLAAVRVMRRS